MTELSSQIAREKFVVPSDTLAKVISDHEAVQALGQKVLASLKDHRPSSNAADEIWQTWMGQANDSRIMLPYKTIGERFSGKFPSYLPEEGKIVQRILWQGSGAIDPTRVGQVFATIGAAGAGKSTLLKKLAGEQIPERIRIDPDEGVLENLGPYLFARTVLRAVAPLTAAQTPEALTAERNMWRMPPYETFRWASNVINTENASLAVAEGRNIEFHWTGAGAFGLKLIKEGYKAAGYPVTFALVVTDLPERWKREAQRLRPASPEDFTSKAIDFIRLLPESLPQGNRIRIYDGDHAEPKVVFEYTQDREGQRIVLAHDRAGAQHILTTMRQDIDRAPGADKTPYLAGLSYATSIIESAPRPQTAEPNRALDLSS